MREQRIEDLSDFLSQRLSELEVELKEKSPKYAKLLKERAAILEREYDDLDEANAAIKRYNELRYELASIEGNFIFIMGMREKSALADTLMSDEFMDRFASLSGEPETIEDDG